MAIINQTRNTILAEKIVIADNPFTRMKGLLGRKKFLAGEALIIKPCDAIHTFFMPFAIDCLFLDKNNKVIKAIAHLKPSRLSRPYFSSRLVIELPAGTIRESLTEEGDLITF